MNKVSAFNIKVQFVCFRRVCGFSAVLLLLTTSFGCATKSYDTEHIVTRDRGEQYSGTTREEVREVLNMGNVEIKSCYEKELKTNSKLSGKLVMKWTFDENGKVTDVAVAKSIDSSNVESCVAGTIKSWIFPKPNNGRFAEVTYPFLFYSASN